MRSGGRWIGQPGNVTALLTLAETFEHFLESLRRTAGTFVLDIDGAMSMCLADKCQNDVALAVMQGVLQKISFSGILRSGCCDEADKMTQPIGVLN